MTGPNGLLHLTYPPAPILEAQGWQVNDEGQLSLTAQTPDRAPQPPWQRPADCALTSLWI
ncbi:MAG: hypothetical protein AAGF01_09400 [Cyanobacteria bacterium P01_G01_bin.38]